jgi:DNA mismatch repair protein MSH3
MLTKRRKEFELNPDGKRQCSSERVDDSMIRSGEKPERHIYTPLESQYLHFRSLNPDMFLLLEVGYKWKSFGEDAEVASSLLGIVAYTPFNMQLRTATFPTHRLSVHMRR